MYREKRLQEILRLVEERGELSSKDARALLNVSRDTVRRDFAFLAADKQVIRTHGGILPLQKSQNVLSFEERLHRLTESKDAIAQKAYQLIAPGQLYFFDVSTSVLRLAQLIDKDVTIYSHSLDNAIVLAQHETVDFHLLGGQFQPKNRFYYALNEAELLKDIHFDAAIIAAAGLKKGQVSFEDAADTYLKKLVLKNAKTKILLAEEDKFEKEASYVLADINDFDYFITDKKPTKAIQKLLSQDLKLIF
ncbi:DeoR/GlpR family DNA-binding transcription regulator [Streptococcus devriesei]|uniref:DeoR/GlpR family DNA-binding transcription regulator n=1 Tax=Streptococcus devriesei TaxID=231233 RepID=UPI00041FD0C9|nr:DeoR/GlpR family DNA-binding transcription regulator [Streptococcus devriesei]